MRRALSVALIGCQLFGIVAVRAEAPSSPGEQRLDPVRDGRPVMMIGHAPSALWNPHGVIVPAGPVAVRNVPDGCEDNGTVVSFVAGGLSFNSGINGGCDNPLAMMAAYGSFDVAAVFELIDLKDPKLTVGGSSDGRDNVSYDRTHAYFRRSLSSEQMAVLRPGQYVLTNAGSPNPTGSILTGWAPDGSSISVAGWIVLGSHNANPAVPTQPRPPALPTVHVGGATNQFGRNTVCGVESSPTLRNWSCWEMDVVNNANSRKNAGGIAILGIGAGGFEGDGVSVGSVSGYAGAFRDGVSVANFQVAGVSVTQTPGIGGVGVYVGMNAGLPIAVQNSTTGANVLTVDSAGTLGRANPTGKTRVLHQVVSGQPANANVAAPLTTDGSGGFDTGGIALVPASMMRLDADLLGVGAAGDGLAWHMAQLISVSARGEASFVGEPAAELQAGPGMSASRCQPPQFVVRNAMVFALVQPCPDAGDPAPSYGGDIRVFVQTR